MTVEEESKPSLRKVSAVFLPSVHEMYPSPTGQDLERQTGTFVEVKGYGDRLEGASRPTFFRGVATVVTKLFNAVQVSVLNINIRRTSKLITAPQPENAYFGQKDIQQALILRRMSRDLLIPMPSYECVHIVPTARDPVDGLALSSRNSYLSLQEREYAATLYSALRAGEQAWSSGGNRSAVLSAALPIIERATEEAHAQGVVIKLDYIKLSDPETFEDITEEIHGGNDDTAVILSGAVWYGTARLIDNIILGDQARIVH